MIVFPLNGQQVMESDDVVPLTAHGISVTIITGSDRGRTSKFSTSKLER